MLVKTGLIHGIDGDDTLLNDAVGDVEVGLPKLAAQRCSFVVPCEIFEQYMISRPICRFRAGWSSTHS